MFETQVADEGFAQSDGATIAWKRYGAGDRAILFVPTWNIVDSRASRHQVPFLAQYATVITYDPRGAGASERPPTGYNFTDHMADAAAVLDATGTERATVITASRGLNPAVLLATDQPARVEALVSVAPGIELDPVDPDEDFWTERERYDGWEKFNAVHWLQDWPDFVRFFMRECFSEPDSERTIAEIVEVALDASPEILVQQEREQDWNLAPPLLPTVGCPTLVLYGNDDRTQPEEIAERVAAAVPDADRAVIEGGGHRPDIRSPEIVNPILARFLELGP